MRGINWLLSLDADRPSSTRLHLRTMQVKSQLLALLSVAACATASLVFHEARAAPPKGFVSRGTTSEDQAIELRVGLASINIDGLRDKLMSVSTPGNAEFRQWLSAGTLLLSFTGPR